MHRGRGLRRMAVGRYRLASLAYLCVQLMRHLQVMQPVRSTTTGLEISTSSTRARMSHTLYERYAPTVACHYHWSPLCCLHDGFGSTSTCHTMYDRFRQMIRWRLQNALVSHLPFIHCMSHVCHHATVVGRLFAAYTNVVGRRLHFIQCMTAGIE